VTDDPATSPQARPDVTGLFLRHSAQVYHLALAAFPGNKHEAEEIVQETFCDVWKGHRKYFANQTDKVREARVIDIAKKRIIDRFRYYRLRRTDSIEVLDELVDVHVNPVDDPCRSAERRMLLDQLWQVISEQLTPTEHRVTFLTWVMDKNDASIASVLGIPTEGTVRSHRSRAVAKIRKHRGPDIIFPGVPGDETEWR
jgi:RNA polymerase sigma factor (sigma-70 family)